MEHGISDHEVLNLANQEDAILLMADAYFGELVFHQEKVTYGVTLIRFVGLKLMGKVEIVANTIENHLAEFPHSFTMIRPNNVRIRRNVSTIDANIDKDNAIM